MLAANHDWSYIEGMQLLVWPTERAGHYSPYHWWAMLQIEFKLINHNYHLTFTLKWWTCQFWFEMPICKLPHLQLIPESFTAFHNCSSHACSWPTCTKSLLPQTPEDIEQVHGTVQEVYDHMQRYQFNDNLKCSSKNIPTYRGSNWWVSITTNAIMVNNSSQLWPVTSSHHLFLHDTNAIAFIVLKYSNAVQLCDIDTPEYVFLKLKLNAF